MKSAPIHVLFLLFAIGVFGDADKVVTVIEGDSVTLHTNVTEIQSSDVIEWRLNGNRIAKISSGSFTTEGSFKDRLQLDKQTGDLKITNIKTTDSGPYVIKIRNSRGSSEKTFNVNAVFNADALKSVSVMVGDSVTLNSDSNTQKDVLQWRFGPQNPSIAEINRAAGIFSYDRADGRFKHRLQLDYLTGSLTIKNIRTNHSGLYEAGIRSSSSGYTIHKSFSVTVSDAGKSVISVKEGESVTLKTDPTEIQRNDFIQWMFGDSHIADVNKQTDRFTVYDDDLDGRFRDRLKPDKQTGSLTITNIRPEDSGLYELKLISSRFTINKRISVTVSAPDWVPLFIGLGIGVFGFLMLGLAVGVFYCDRYEKPHRKNGRLVCVDEGESLDLLTHGTPILKDDNLMWMFGDAPIAERKGGVVKYTPCDDDVLDERFRDRLKLDEKTGSLTITNTRNEDSGYYKLQINTSGHVSSISFNVYIFAKTDPIQMKMVKKGGSVLLETGVTNIQRGDEVEWMKGLENSPIAVIKGGTKKIPLFAVGWRSIFILKLDQNGSLTIKNIKPTDSGCYVLKLIKSGKTSFRYFRVIVSDAKNIGNNPEGIPLNQV